MRRMNISPELEANIIFEHERRGEGARKISKKFGVDASTVTRILQRYRAVLNGGIPKGAEKIEFTAIEMPDEDLQSEEQKIAFYKDEAEKYKALATALEKKLGLSKKERDGLCAMQIESLLERHERKEAETAGKMSRDEFMEFFSNFGAR